MADRHADARRVARELSSHFGNPLDFTLRLFLTGSKNIVIPDHVFLHKGKVKGLLRYTISTGGLFFDPQWPAIDVSQTAESLFSQKAVDVDMHLNQTIARHFASRLGPAMVFLPLLQNQHHSGGGSNNNNIDHHSSHVDHNPDVEHIITARYFSKESLFDVVGDLRASKASGILLEYRTPLDGYHNLLRATFTPFLLVMEMRKSNHSLKEHRVPLKLKVSTSAQKGGSNLAKEVQVPPSASALACDILNALVTKKEEGGEFVERCVAYFTVISPRQVLFLWCTQMNVMPMEHANQLSEQVTCLNDNNHNNKDGTSENNNNTASQSKASKSLQEKDQKTSPSSKKKTISASATVATASSYNQHHPNKDGNDDQNNKDGQNNNNNNNNNVTSTNSSLNKKGKVVNNINSVNAIKVHPDATTDQSFLSRQLLHDLKLIGHKKNSDESQQQQQANTTAGEATDVGMLSEINNNNNDEEYELSATQEENVVWEDGHSEENYIREHSTIMQHLPSGYSAMRDEKKFVSSLQRVRENYDSPLNKKNNASKQEPGENEDPQAVRNLATVAAARKVARMFGIAKQELPSRPKELDRYSKSNRSLEAYSASRTQHARKQTVSKRKQELDKLALALNRAKQRREEEQLRQTFYGNTANVKRSKKTTKKSKLDPFGATVTSATGDEEDVNTHEEVEAQAAVEDDEEEEEEEEEEEVPPPAAIILPELPSAARDVTLLSDAEFDDYLAEIQDQTYERFDCGMSGYVIDMPAHFIFSKYGKPRFNYGDSGGGHGNASGGGGKNNNYNNNAGSSASAATLLDQLLHPGSLRDLKRKERHTRNAPPLIDVGAGKSYIEQTVSSKVGQDLLSSKLLGVNHQTRRKQLLEQEQQRNNTKNNNNNNNNAKMANNSNKRTGSPANASNKKTDKNVKKKSSSNNNNVTSRSRSVSELMFNQLNNNHDNADQSPQHHQHHLRKTHQSQYSNSETAQTPNSNDLENQISIMNRFANENYRQQRKFSSSVSPSRNQKLLSHSVSKRSLLTTGSSSTPQQQHLMSSYGSTSKKNNNENESNTGDGVSSLEVMAYLNSTSATRMNRRKRENHKGNNSYGRRSPSNDESHQKHQQGIYREHDDDDDDDDEEYDDDSSNESSNASEELMLQTTAEPSNQTTGVIKTTGYSQQDASRLTYTVHKIRNLGQAIFQTAADLLYRACSHQAARRSVVEIVIPFGYRHLDQELRSTFLTLGLEEQPIELMGRINEFREQHENDGTSYGELALNTPIGDVQSMFDDESFVRQSNGQIASLRDEWYSLEGGGSVEFVLRQAQTAVPRAEKLLQTLEAELNPLARFDTPLCTPNDVKCCERLCELVDVRGFTICDAANVLVNERKQKQDQMMFMAIQQQQQQGRKR